MSVEFKHTAQNKSLIGENVFQKRETSQISNLLIKGKRDVQWKLSWTRDLFKPLLPYINTTLVFFLQRGPLTLLNYSARLACSKHCMSDVYISVTIQSQNRTLGAQNWFSIAQFEGVSSFFV